MSLSELEFKYKKEKERLGYMDKQKKRKCILKYLCNIDPLSYPGDYTVSDFYNQYYQLNEEDIVCKEDNVFCYCYFEEWLIINNKLVGIVSLASGRVIIMDYYNIYLKDWPIHEE